MLLQSEASLTFLLTKLKVLLMSWSFLKQDQVSLSPTGLFKVPGYALPLRLDNNQFGDDIMVL